MKQVFTLNAKNVLLIAVFCLNATTMFAGNTANSNPSTVPSSSIEVSTNEKWVSFKWMTSIQANFNYYEVERSTDNKNFKTVGMVMDGFETAQSQKSFQFRDQKSALKGNNTVYYRMKQVNMDGTVEYSEVVTVKL